MQKSDRVITILGNGSLLNLRITHKNAQLSVLEGLNFRDVTRASREVSEIPGVEECVILQTCNRVEIYLSTSPRDEESAEIRVAEYWIKTTGFDADEFYRHLVVSRSSNVQIHLMRLTSGLESMVVGEDQILGQVRDAFKLAKECGTTGSVLAKVFGGAVKMGRMIRVKTGINRGSVSLGSIAANILEKLVEDFEGKKVLIIGAGRIGALTGKALAARKIAFIFVTNRTYDRAMLLSKKLNAKVVKFDRLVESLSRVDVAIVATSAPHYILTRSKIEESLKAREKGRKLVIVDLSLPSNVENSVTELPGIEMHNIDNLRTIADSNRRIRIKEAKKAEELIQNTMNQITSLQKQEDIKPTIHAAAVSADTIRRRDAE